MILPLFQRHQVQLWLPELDEPGDFDDPTHLAPARLLGVQAKREILQARSQVQTAMRAQACVQARPAHRTATGSPNACPHPN